jgi:heme exporter protein A
VVSHATFLYGNLTPAENLRFYGKMYDVPNLEDRIEEVLDQVHLRSRIHDRVATLSRGMQQRVAIARSIIHNPSIMLMDEPETGLDPHATIMMREVLDSINSGDRTVVVTTHDLGRGLELGDRIAILHKGRVVFEAPKAEIDAGRVHELYDEHTGAVLR